MRRLDGGTRGCRIEKKGSGTFFRGPGSASRPHLQVALGQRFNLQARANRCQGHFLMMGRGVR